MKIDKASLIDGSELAFGDFNVFVGGNGVGKTTFIAELFHKASELPRNKYFWIKETGYSSQNVADDLRLLNDSLARQWDGSNLYFFSNAARNVDGNVDLASDLRFSAQDREQFKVANADIFNNRRYRRPFLSFSSCESRLSLAATDAMTALDQPPQNPINVLYRNRTLQKNIDKNVFQVFKHHLVVLAHRQTQLEVGLSKEKAPVFNGQAESLQDEFEKLEAWKRDNFIPITEAGHGIRSMIKLLTSLLEPVNHVILIDEPEMHLYPSQKRWLGRQLVTLAGKQEKQVFVVTHDPMVLQGILDANKKTSIFRVDKSEDGKGSIKVCEFDKKDVGHAKNQEQYLQSLFYQRCIVVEGASDRSFYQQLLEDYPEVEDKDLGVVVAGGVGNSKHIAYLGAKIGLRIAFIYDLDVLIENQSLMKDIYAALGGNGNPIDKLEALTKAMQPNGQESKEQCIKRITGYQRKSGFSEQWTTDNAAIMAEAFSNLDSVGIFIVPRGALESWVPEVEEKVRFAEKAPPILRGTAELEKRFDDFAKRVLQYLDI